MAMRSVVLLAALWLGCGHVPWEQPNENWKRVESTRFIFQTDSSPDDHTPVIDRLEDVHEALSISFFKDVQIDKMEVLLFDSASDFRGVAPDGNVAGFFMPMVGTQKKGVLVFPLDSEFNLVASVAAHELAHAFLNAMHPELPAWLHEGFAKYIGAVNVIEDHIAFDAGEIHGGYTYFADLVPLKRLFASKNRDFHGSAELDHYMTSWLFMRELMASKVDNKKARFRQLVDRIATVKSPQETMLAIEETFSVKLAEVESRMQTYHTNSRSGVGQAIQRTGMGAQVTREGRTAIVMTPADGNAVRALCVELRTHTRF